MREDESRRRLREQVMEKATSATPNQPPTDASTNSGAASTSEDAAACFSTPEDASASTSTTTSNLMMSMADTPVLFSQTNVRKPEYWQYAKLIAPSHELPEGKKQWTTDDAVGIWCLRCAKGMAHKKGSSQNIRYHMENVHADDLARFRDKIKV